MYDKLTHRQRATRSSVTKLDIDMYYGMTNSYTKFQDNNISKDCMQKKVLKAKDNNYCKSRSSVTILEPALYYDMTTHIINVKSIYQKTAEKSPEN